MRKKLALQSGIVTPRLLIALALCSSGVLLGMFSLAATPLSELASGAASGAEPTARSEPTARLPARQSLQLGESESSPSRGVGPSRPEASRKPVETTRADTSVPPDPANFPSTFGSSANRPAAVATLAEEALPPGVPLPPSLRAGELSEPEAGLDAPFSGLDAPPGRKPGSQFSPNGQGDLSSGRPTAGFAGMPLRPGTLSAQQSAASEDRLLAPTAESDWSNVTSPNNITTQGDLLNGITCVSASQCWAVGYYRTGNAFQTLIERWDGTSWAIVPSPNASTTRSSVLNGVTCVSASDCWAVGYYVDPFTPGFPQQSLIEHWDGTSWVIVTSPNIPTHRNVLSGVTCVSASECWAVGYYFTGAFNQTLIQHWDGTSWSIVSSPNTSTTQRNYLYGVTCASASNCWAVGSYVNGSLQQTLIERWDGISWAIVTSPNLSLSNVLLGVTCVSASECWAVGNWSRPSNLTTSIAQTLIERWNGISWTIVISPNTSATQHNALYGVTCASASDCWAVGQYSTDTGIDQTLIQRWNGTLWTIVTSPNPGTALRNFLYGVTCVSASDCWAVGVYSTGTAIPQTLVQRWNGTSWAITTSPPAPSAPNHNFLSSVTCVSASDCWAVGYYVTANAWQTLIQRWNGISWAIFTSPNTSATQDNRLYGVTCVSASDCWAIGQYGDINNASQTLIERWNGTSWTIVNSPNVSPHNSLYGVTCVSASDCWAVGHYFTGSAWQPLVERWNGTSWTIGPLPNTLATPDNFLFGVTCASASDCWAVGQYGDNNSTWQTLIERWNGTSWAMVTSPNVSQNNSLYGVTCASASDCWAVGQYFGGPWKTLIERWDGTSWAIVNSPNGNITTYNRLNGVTCVSASDCWAVGYYSNGDTGQTLTERWNGTSWVLVTSSNTGATENNTLSGVTCASASECWAVGQYAASVVAQTLVLRYTANLPPTPTSVVSRKTHGTAGTFDIDLPLTGEPGIECRQGQGTNSDEHQVILTFGAPATVGSAACDETPATTSTSGNDVTVNCTGVPNAKVITIALTDVSVGTTSGNVSASMGVLVGDITANGSVSNTDVSAVKAQVSAPVTSSNFRNDVNANGVVSNTDVSTTKAQVSTTLP